MSRGGLWGQGWCRGDTVGTGEEAQLAQEKMEALRMRYLIAGQSSADAEQRLRQALEASSRLGTAPEELALWLGRMETELGSWDREHEAPVSDSDREKVRDRGTWAPSPPARGCIQEDLSGWHSLGCGWRCHNNGQWVHQKGP